MKKVLLYAGIAFLGIAFTSCQQVFTYSPLKAFQRSPTSMSPQQKVEYAQEALASGDTSAMKQAFDAIKDSTDPQTNLLASQLAFGASGATQVFNQVLGALASGSSSSQDVADLSSTVQTAINNVDVNLAAEGAQQLADAAAGGAAVTDEQYAVAAASLVASAVKQSGDSLTDFLNNPPASGTAAGDTLAEAQSLASNIQSSDVTQLLSTLNL